MVVEWELKGHPGGDCYQDPLSALRRRAYMTRTSPSKDNASFAVLQPHFVATSWRDMMGAGEPINTMAEPILS